MNETTELKKIIDLEIKGEESVNSLVESLKGLNEQLVALEKNSQEYKDILKVMAQQQSKLKSAMRGAKEDAELAEGSYAALSKEMSNLRKEWKNTADEQKRSDLGKSINEINTRLKEMDASIGNFQRNVGDYSNQIKQAFTNPEEEIRKLKLELFNLEEGSEAYNNALARMSKLTTQQKILNEQLVFVSGDLGDILGNLSGAASSIAGGFEAVNSLMVLFGNSSPEVEQALLRIQALMGLVQGLEALEQIGDRFKGLKAGLKALREEGGETAKVVQDLNTASQASATATNASAAATNAFGASAKSASAGVAELNKEVAVSSNALGAYKIQTETISKSLDDLNKRRNSILANMAYIERTGDDKNNYYPKLKEQLAEVNKEIGELKTRQDKLNDTWEESIKSGKSVKTEISGIATSANAASKGAKALNFSMKALKTTLKGLGIGALVVVAGELLSLLTKGIGKLTSWISGTEKLNKAVRELSKSQRELNSHMEGYNSIWDFNIRIMEAQGKSYDEIYEYRKKNLQQLLTEAETLLYTSKAWEVYNGLSEKDRRKERNQGVVEQVNTMQESIKSLRKELQTLEDDRYIYRLTEQQNALSGSTQNLTDQTDDYTESLKIRIETEKAAIESARTLRNEQIRTAAELARSNAENSLSGKDRLQRSFYSDTDVLNKGFLASLGISTSGEAVLEKAFNKNLISAQEYVDGLSRLRKKDLSDANEYAKGLAQAQESFNKEYRRIVSERDKGLATAQGDSAKDLIKGQYLENMANLFSDYRNYVLEIAPEKFLSFREEVIAGYQSAFKGIREFYKSETQKLTGEELTAYYETFFQRGVALAEKAIYDARTELERKTLQREESDTFKNYSFLDFIFGRDVDTRSAKKRIEEIREIYSEQIALLETEFSERQNEILNRISGYQSILSGDIDNDTRVKTEENIANSLMELENLITENELANSRIRIQQAKDETQAKVDSWQQQIDSANQYLSGISNLAGALGEAHSAETELLKSQGKLSEEQERKRFEDNKKFQIAQAVINMLQGISTAFASAMTLGPVAGPIVGSLNAATVLATGTASINRIKATTFDGSSSSSSGSYVLPSVENFSPDQYSNDTGESDVDKLLNAFKENQIRAYVVESDITASQKRTRDRVEEATW